MKRYVVVILLCLLVLPMLIFLGAQFSLDRTFAHTKKTEGLPLLDESTTDGLVRIPVGDMQFRARVAGLDNQGPPLILLHGFPETSIMWEPLILRAASEGFRVIAYDHRGFSPGARPLELESYSAQKYVEDLMQIADVAGFEDFHLIGHDWGALIGWLAAIEYSQRVKTWAALSIPHPGAFVMKSEDRPTYVQVFRIPQLAESLLGFAGLLPLQKLLYESMSDREKAEYLEVFREPGALTAALNLYRALSGPPVGFDQPTKQPVLYIYGTEDIPAYVNPEVQARLPSFVEGPFESLALDMGHWLIQDEPEVVVNRLMEHLHKYKN